METATPKSRPDLRLTGPQRWSLWRCGTSHFSLFQNATRPLIWTPFQFCIQGSALELSNDGLTLSYKKGSTEVGVSTFLSLSPPWSHEQRSMNLNSVINRRYNRICHSPHYRTYATLKSRSSTPDRKGNAFRKKPLYLFLVFFFRLLFCHISKIGIGVADGMYPLNNQPGWSIEYILPLAMYCGSTDCITLSTTQILWLPWWWW